MRSLPESGPVFHVLVVLLALVLGAGAYRAGGWWLVAVVVGLGALGFGFNLCVHRIRFGRWTP